LRLLASSVAPLSGDRFDRALHPLGLAPARSPALVPLACASLIDKANPFHTDRAVPRQAQSLLDDANGHRAEFFYCPAFYCPVSPVARKSFAVLPDRG
jgi:hypothetical protein